MVGVEPGELLGRGLLDLVLGDEAVAVGVHAREDAVGDRLGIGRVAAVVAAIALELRHPGLHRRHELVLGDLAVMVGVVAHEPLDAALLELGQGDLFVAAARAGAGPGASVVSAAAIVGLIATAAALRAGAQQRQGRETDRNGRPHGSQNSVQSGEGSTIYAGPGTPRIQD